MQQLILGIRNDIQCVIEPIRYLMTSILKWHGSGIFDEWCDFNRKLKILSNHHCQLFSCLCKYHFINGDLNNLVAIINWWLILLGKVWLVLNFVNYALIFLNSKDSKSSEVIFSQAIVVTKLQVILWFFTK